MSTIAVNTITDASGGNTATINSYTPTESNMAGRNRIINGDMRIDQRNAGASVDATNGAYTVDRWLCTVSQSSKFTAQQNAGSTTPPAGFINYLGCTSSSAYSVTSTDFLGINQRIEGLNIADLGWGTANAKSVTLSFWVRSSLTGTFGGSFMNSAFDRSYPFTYTISSANTWEQKSVTIAGDTSGTWLSTNGVGVRVFFSLGCGSTRLGTAGAWTGSSNIFSATGETSVVGTNGATWYITGVQLEAGSVATSFERVDYSEMLRRCQRYYAKTYPTDVTPGTGGSSTIALGRSTDAASSYTTIAHWSYPVTMRAAPSISLFNPVTGVANSFRADAGDYSSSQTIFNSTYAVTVNAGGVSIGASNYVSTHIVASSEL